MTDKKHDFAKSALFKTAFGKDISLQTAPIEFKADKQKSKPKPNANDKEEEIEFENPFDEFVKTWKQGDPLPFVPPGMVFHLCKFSPNNLDIDVEYLGLEERFRKKPDNKVKKKSSITDIEVKNLGPKLRTAVETVRQRALRRRGGLVPWVDENNKLRCPAGTPAANQFTDEMMSNCFIISPETVAGAGRRAIRRAGEAADILSSKPGQRVSTRTIPGDIDVSTQDGIRKLGPQAAQALMNVGGRIGVQSGVAGAMGGGFGFRADAGKRSSSKAWQLGVKEQIERGRRLTYLADDLHKRIMNPSGPDGIRLPSGAPIGDIRNKANFMRAMTEVFPNVNPLEIEQLFDKAMPQNLSYLDRVKFRKAMISYYEGVIFEAINAPENYKWISRIAVDPSMKSAVEIKIEPFAPSITTGGRLSSGAAQNLARSAGNAAQGGVHFSMTVNPTQLWLASRGYGFSKNGRSNGISHSQRGDMLYTAVHESGHVAHFASIMRALGFGDIPDDPANRYQMARTLTPGTTATGGVPTWSPNVEVGGWMIDWTQAQNPLASPSIDAAIQAASNLQTRNYRGGNYGRGIYGFTRKDLEQDINNFYNGIIEAIHNNITDTPDDVEIMRAFAGGDYAASNSIEARAEYYMARRLFGETQDTRSWYRRTRGLVPLPNPAQNQNYVLDFADAWAQRPSNRLAGGGLVRTPAEIYTEMDRIGENISGVTSGTWNVTGRMQGATIPRQTLKGRAVARAVRSAERLSDPNSAQWRQNAIVGRMSSITSAKRENTLPTISPSSPEPLGIIRPQPRDAGRSARILEQASRVNGVTWSNPVPNEELQSAVKISKAEAVKRFEFQKESLSKGIPDLTSPQKDWLQKVIVGANKPLTEEDIETILKQDSSSYGHRVALLREDARLRGDTARVDRIDAFVDRVNNMSAKEYESMLPGFISSNTSRADKRIHVMMENPSLLETTGRYLTIHDKEERDALGIGFTGFANQEYTADVRKGVEQSFGIPFSDDEAVKKLRPASGFLPHGGSGNDRIKRLRSEYGSDVQVMHPYAIGFQAAQGNGVSKYGTNMVILRSEVSERSKVLAGDSAADRNGYGNLILPVNEMLKPENNAILQRSTGAAFLWDEIVGQGGPNSSSSRGSYNEAVVLGSFNLSDDVDAVVVSPGNFNLTSEELSELPPGINARSSYPVYMPTKLIQAAQFRDRMREKHGIDVVVGLPHDMTNQDMNKFSIDEVELFNPQMTRRWMSKNFPEANFEEAIPDSQTTPYEAFLRHTSKSVNPDSASGRIIATEIERLDELKTRTYGDTALGRGSLAERIDSRGMELLPAGIRRSVVGRMSTQRITPSEMVEVPELQKRGIAERKQRLSDAENRVAKLEEGLKILEETGEWRGGQLGVIVGMANDPTLDSIDNPDIKPNNKTRAEVEAMDGGLEGLKEKVKEKILTSKREAELQKYLAEAKQTRVKQNVLDLEDISPEELEVLKEEGRQIRELMANDKDSFVSLVSSSDENKEFVVHAGSSELDGGVLNSDKTVGTEGRAYSGNTQYLNRDNITMFVADYDNDVKLNEAAPKLSQKLKSREVFVIESREELSILSEIGVADVKTKIGDTVDLPSRYGENYSSGIDGLLQRFEINTSKRKERISTNGKTIKALKDNPRSGFLSAQPVYDGAFATRGYFGRYSDTLIPKDVADVRTEQQTATTGERTSVKDPFIHTRWMDSLRGTAWLVEGERDSQISSQLGPNWERQILGVTKPDFGFSARRNDSYVVDDVGFAVMARAIQLRKEGKEVTPKSVLEYSTPVSKRLNPDTPRSNAVTGRMSSATTELDVGKRIDTSVKQSELDISSSREKLENLEKALKVLEETGEWKGADFGVTHHSSNAWFVVGFDDPDFKPENFTAAELASGSAGGVDKLKESVAKKIKNSQKYIRIQEDLAQRKAIRREQNVLDVEDISAEEYAELLSEAEYIKTLSWDSDERKEFFGPNGDEWFVQHSGSSELKGGVLNPARSVGSTQAYATTGGDTRGVNNLVRSRIDASVKEFETDLDELKNLKKWADSNPSGGTYVPTYGVFSKNYRSLQRAGHTLNSNEDLVVSADGVERLKAKVDKDIAELSEKLKQGKYFLSRLDENDGQHLSAYPAGKEVSTGGLGYFASQANSEIPEDIGTFPTQFQENSGVPRVTKDFDAADHWQMTRRGTVWLVSGKWNQDITAGFANMANTPDNERQILGIQTPMFGVSQVVGSNSRKGLDQIAPALVARAIKLRKEGKGVSPESVLSNPLRRSVTGAMSSGEPVKRPKYPRTPTYGVAIGKGDDLFSSATSWKEFKRIYGDREVVFLDYETTGLVFDEFGKATSNGAPVQIGAVKWKNGRVTERFNVFINPGEKLGEWSRNNLKDRDGNPLTDEWLSSQPSIAEAHRQLAEFAGPDAIMGVQNASFDKNVLDDALKAAGIEWAPAGYIDTKEIASMVLPRWTPENPDGPVKMGADGVKRPSNGLKEITEYLGVNLGEKHHTADADAEAAAEVMQKIIDGAIENGWSDRIFSKSTRQAHIDKVNQKHREEIEEFKIARAAFLAEVERLATKRDDGSANNSATGKMASNPLILEPRKIPRDYELVPGKFDPQNPSWDKNSPEGKVLSAFQKEILDVGGFITEVGGAAKPVGASKGHTWKEGKPLYHLASIDALESIKKDGLMNRGNNPLYFVTTPQAWKNSIPLWNANGSVYLRVKPEGEFLDKLRLIGKEIDEKVQKKIAAGNTFATDGLDDGMISFNSATVPAEQIEILNALGEWQPLIGSSSSDYIGVKTVSSPKKYLIDNPYNEKVARAFGSVERLETRRKPKTY